MILEEAIDSQESQSVQEENTDENLERPRLEYNAHDIIYSDDEFAIEKLQAKLDYLQNLQEKMKRVNREYKKNGNDLDAIAELTDDDKSEIRSIMSTCRYDRLPYESFSLVNNSAVIRSVKKRIKYVKRERETPARADIHREYYYISEKIDDKRIWFVFKKKPVREIRERLRHSGFKWSPKREAWVTYLNQKCRNSADFVDTILIEHQKSGKPFFE